VLETPLELRDKLLVLSLSLSLSIYIYVCIYIYIYMYIYIYRFTRVAAGGAGNAPRVARQAVGPHPSFARNVHALIPRPVHLTITMIKWFRTSRLSIKNSFSGQVDPFFKALIEWRWKLVWRFWIFESTL